MGSLVCLVLLTALRVPRDRLKAQEESGSRSTAASLAHALWRLTPPQELRLRRWRRWVNLAQVAVLGGLLGSATLCAAAKFVSSSRAMFASLVVSASCWLSLGLSILTNAQREALEEGVTPRPHPRLPPKEQRTQSCKTSAQKPSVARPVTVLTGFLGAGKTTLLKRILTEEHHLRILVIENELGEEGIDHELVMRGGDDDDIILLRNGCIGCAIRDDLR
jgi:hypothetical protein